MNAPLRVKTILLYKTLRHGSWDQIVDVSRVRKTETLDSRPTEYSVQNFSAEKFSVSAEYRESRLTRKLYVILHII